jgi:hypothetical protein
MVQLLCCYLPVLDMRYSCSAVVYLAVPPKLWAYAMPKYDFRFGLAASKVLFLLLRNGTSTLLLPSCL